MSGRPRRESFERSAAQLVGGNVAGSALLAVLVVILPRYVSIADYGYWQLYLFYATYLGYLSFGLADGIFLRYSGSRLEDVPARVVTGHVRALLVLAGTTLGIAAAVVWALVPDRRAAAAVALACASTVAYLVRSLLTFTYQAANRPGLMATSLVLERLVGLVVVVVLLSLGRTGLVGILLADVAGRVVGLGYTLVRARGLVFVRALPARESLHELRESFRGGIFVSIAAIATVLVTAVGRFAAERGFGIEAFAQVALAFSLVNIVLTVVTPVSLAVLPNIRRQPAERLPAIYQRGLDLVMPGLVLSLLAYLPMAWAVGWWLPRYTLLPAFLGAMLPVVVFESRTRLFAIPFLQGLRRERSLAAVNVASLLGAAGLAAFAVLVLHSVLATVLTVTVAVVGRALVLERLTTRALGLARRPRTAAELVVSVLFVLATSGRFGWLPWAALAVCWGGYLWWCRAMVTKLVLRLARSARPTGRGGPAPTVQG
ncbi:polysaccharide biosynthesis protein [Phycicoccus flavus]|uniref:hypothetical protein n=1 Tax=Phycicoccus flavus TaxID=2502783 RepID=UPI000FEBE95C|nr:hypothetical protein [Phycicoccus flavus]NHA66683.1 hypothetical protein [Phycicoccus flavus]